MLIRRKIFLLGIFLTVLIASASAASFGVTTHADWNEGVFNGTSADRDGNSGILGLGYRNGTPGDHLWGYWRFDGSNGDILDYSTNDSGGDARGDPERGATGVFSTDSIKFDGSGDWAQFGQKYNTGNELTVSAWFRADKFSGTNDWNYILAKESGGADDNESFILRIEKDSANTLSFYKFDGSWVSVTWDGPQTGQWYHVAAGFNSTHQFLYVNGSLKDLKSTSTDMSPSSANLAVGSIGEWDGDPKFAGRYWNGSIDEVKIWNQGLSSQEIKDEYLDGRDQIFNGDYNSTAFNLLSNDKPSKLYVNTTDVTPTNQVWATVLTSSGEQEIINISTGSTSQNYTLSFSNTGGVAWVRLNMTSSSSTTTPKVPEFTLFTKTVPPDTDSWLNESGDVMTGILDMGSNRIIDLKLPTNSSDAVPKQYVDGKRMEWADEWVNKSGGSMTGNLDMSGNELRNVGRIEGSNGRINAPDGFDLLGGTILGSIACCSS